MTTTVNGYRPTDTVRDEVTMCVRASENPVEASEPGSERENSMYTHVIQDEAQKVKSKRERMSQTVTTHANDLGKAALRSWTLHEEMPTHDDVWTQVRPPQGSHTGRFARLTWTADATGGVFRACVTSLAILIAQSLGSRIRAQVGLALFVLAILAVVLGGYLT